jgi:pyruvate dehydrogenase E1 component beta subunit
MAERFLVEAVNDALHVEMERDGSVMVMGEDVGRAGGVFRATAGLRDRFGPNRCVETPLAEAGILGTAVGLCMAGW